MIRDEPMNERITFISVFNDMNLEKIEHYTKKINDKLCKVPYGKNVEDRIENDTLPYHFTLFALCIQKKEEFLEFLESFKFSKFTVLVESLELVNGAEDSYELRFHIVRNKELVKLQKQIAEFFPTKTYIPGEFNFHITIDVRKDLKEITRIKNVIEKEFVPFELEIDTFGLFSIYPAKLIKKTLAI